MSQIFTAQTIWDNKGPEYCIMFSFLLQALERSRNCLTLIPQMIDGGNSVAYSLLRWREALGLNLITAVLNRSLTYMGQDAKLTAPLC